MMRKHLYPLFLAAAMTLSLGATAAADTVVTDFTSRYMIVNRNSDSLGYQSEENGYYGLIDAEGNPITDPIYMEMQAVSGHPYFKVETADSTDGIHCEGLIDDQGNTLVPPEYADISIVSDRWITAVKLTPSSSDDKDYTYSNWSTGENSFYRIDTVDFFYNGEKVGTLSRSEYDGYPTAHGDYICITSRDKHKTFYNSSFEKSPVTGDSSSEYETNYKNGKTTYIHNGSGQAAFTEGCTLTPEEVDSAYIYDKGVVYDLQGKEVFKAAQNYDSVRNYQDGYAVVSMNGLKGMIDLEGNEIIPVEYDEIGNYTEHPFLRGYVSAVKEGKFGFLDRNAGVTSDFVYSADAVSDRTPLATIQNLDGSVIVLSAAVGELPEHYYEVTIPSSDGSMCFIGENSDRQYTLVDLYGNTLIPYTDDTIEVNAAGTVAVVRTDYGQYQIYHFDEALQEAPAAESAPEASTEEVAATWTCENGHEGNTGNFCTECGAPKPAEEEKAVCSACGYEFTDGVPKFCPNCGAAIEGA